jgi:hypothetical protein
MPLPNRVGTAAVVGAHATVAANERMPASRLAVPTLGWIILDMLHYRATSVPDEDAPHGASRTPRYGVRALTRLLEWAVRYPQVTDVTLVDSTTPLRSRGSK